MSIENVFRFMAEIARDESLLDMLKEADMEEMLTAAKDRGMEFNADELRQVCEGVNAPEELDLDELDSVTGGSLVAQGGTTPLGVMNLVKQVQFASAQKTKLLETGPDWLRKR